VSHDEMATPLVSGALGELARLAEGVDSAVRRDAEALSRRLAEGRFYVACLGQLKRGKSTLLNALVGTAVLPTGVTPVTSVVTVVRYGANRAARVCAESSGWTAIDPATIALYASERENPGNAKHVTGIEVFEPSTLLRSGLCLVDTPGVGSVFLENTTATREFLPQIDAALFVLGADPPITADELQLIEEVSRRVPHRIFVLSKADRTSDEERAEAVRFTKDILRERVKGDDQVSILVVSGADALLSGRPTGDWPALVQALQQLATGAGANLVADAEKRGLAYLNARLVAAVEERIGLLERPLADSEARLAARRARIADAERALSDLAPLLGAEEARLLGQVERDREEFFVSAAPLAERTLEARLASLAERGPALRARALTEATATAKATLDEWRRPKAVDVERLYREANARFVEMLRTVNPDAASASGGTSGEPLLAIDRGLRGGSTFYMTEMLAVAPDTLGARVADALAAPFGGRGDVVRRDARAYLRQLLEVNSARIKNDLRERLTASRRELEGDVRRRLQETIRSAEAALGEARALRAAGSAAVGEELQRLRSTLAAVMAVGASAEAAGGAGRA
jgi:GTP-binding protein EngB required for normal cell division